MRPLMVMSVSAVLCSISIRRAGWLDRVVQYQKKRFIDDLIKESPLRITARIEKSPPGYVDSKDWDYDSVIRLLTLIRDNDGAAPVRFAFRRAAKTRRFLSFAETFKAFPSLIKEHPNDFHYQVDSGEYYADVEVPEHNNPLELADMIVVSNPVEAKLPSASISIQLLKNILERRAEAGRVMPTTELLISWPVTMKRTTTATEDTDAAEATSIDVTTVTDEVKVTTPEVLETNDTVTVNGTVPDDNTTTTTNEAATS